LGNRKYWWYGSWWKNISNKELIQNFTHTRKFRTCTRTKFNSIMVNKITRRIQTLYSKLINQNIFNSIWKWWCNENNIRWWLWNCLLCISNEDRKTNAILWCKSKLSKNIIICNKWWKRRKIWKTSSSKIWTNNIWISRLWWSYGKIWSNDGLCSKNLYKSIKCNTLYAW